MARTNSIKNWLLITRAPTLLSVLVPVMVGFLAAGGELFTMRGLGFVAFAWAMHHFTFAHNSLLDAAYDVGKKDPEHHPLASGAVSLGQARTVVYAGMLVTCALGAALALTGGGNPAASLVCLLFFVIGGFAYNECSKVAPKAWALLALSFACLTPFAYFAVAPAADARMILLAGYFFLTFWFETWWSGNLKDLEFAGANALRDLGVRVRGAGSWSKKAGSVCEGVEAVRDRPCVRSYVRQECVFRSLCRSYCRANNPTQLGAHAGARVGPPPGGFRDRVRGGREPAHAPRGRRWVGGGPRAGRVRDCLDPGHHQGGVRSVREKYTTAEG